MKTYFRLFLTAFTLNFKSALEYRVNFLLQFVGMILNNGAFAIFWLALLARTGPLGGYQFGDVMFLWALGPAAFGLAHVLCGNVSQLGKIIQNGDLDIYLLQPKDPQFHVLISRSSLSAWGDLIYGLIVISCLSFDPLRWLLFVVLTVCGAVLFTASFSLLQSLTFFWGGSEGLARAFREFILSFTLYPETIFPSGFRWVLYSLIPAGFLAFLPLGLYKTLDLWLLVPIVAAALGYSLLSAWVFRRGLKHYESGNLMGTRI